MNTTDVQGTLREMWETRPARPRQDRQIAGVASAIARRYDIDPVLVRIGFVAATFAGIGAALYIAGWVLLPEEPADPAAPVPARSPRGVLVVGLAIAAAVSVGSIFGGDGNVLLPAIAVAVLLFLLHRSRGGHGVGTVGGSPATGATAAAAGPSTGSSSGPSMVKDVAGTPPAPTPPAWDPLGAAPFAWDLPEPGPVPPPVPQRRRLPVTAVTLGVALLAGGVTAVVLLIAGALTLANLPLLFGVVLAVLGSGLVVGAFLHAGRGLIPIAILTSMLAWSVVAAPLDRWQGNGFGELHLAPATVAELQPTYERTFGQVDLDLRNLDLTEPAGGNSSPVRTSVSVGAGDVRVAIPPDADLRLTTSVGVGRAAFGSREESGPGSEIDIPQDLGADGVRSGRLLVLDIEAGAGNVEVRRG